MAHWLERIDVTWRDGLRPSWVTLPCRVRLCRVLRVSSFQLRDGRRARLTREGLHSRHFYLGAKCFEGVSTGVRSETMPG